MVRDNKNSFQFIPVLGSRSSVKDKLVPLLSVVIPTRNRIKYAISAIESILTFTTDIRLELVVQDNSDSRELQQYVDENIRDNRLRYNYTSTTLAYIQNFDKAIALSKGEYICIIGDDDGINPEIMSAVCWAKEKGVDVISVMGNPFYLWPGTDIKSTIFTKIEGGLLRIPEPFDGSFRPFDVILNVKKYLQTNVSGSEIQFARLYHGIVRRSCLEQIFVRTGSYMKGLCPDIYASMVLSEVAKNAFVTSYPLTISGACNASATVESMTGKHEGALDRAIHLRGLNGYTWDVLVPRFYSPETIWADSALAALRHIGRADLVASFNVARFSALCFARYRRHGITAIRGMYKGSNSLHKNNIQTTALFLYYLLLDTPIFLARRIYNRLRIFCIGEGVVRIRGLCDMIEVTRTLIDYLKKKGKSIDQFLS